jgi:hypothetical protein
MDFFAVKVAGYDVKGGICEARNKRKLICITSFDVISGKFNCKKVDEDDIFA